MSYAEFQAHWEQAASAQYDGYLALPAPALIAHAQARRYGQHYQLWRAIATRATLTEAGYVLLGVLRRDDPYLVRYHAAAALLVLLGPQASDPVDLAAERPSRAANLDAVERILRDRLIAGAAT